MTGTEVEKRTPPVHWAERRNLLYVFVHVPDTQKPEIKLTSDSLNLRTKNAAGIIFEVTLNFYKEINVETSKYCISDRGVDFFLKKAEEGPYWNRLLKDNQKDDCNCRQTKNFHIAGCTFPIPEIGYTHYHWLKIDFNRWRDEDDSDAEMNEDEFEEMMKKMSGLQSSSNDLNDLEPESDEEEA